MSIFKTLAAPITQLITLAAVATLLPSGIMAAYNHPLDVPAELDGSSGVELLGADSSLTGISVSGAGDINGDGLGDVIVGAPQQAVGGAAYVVFGQAGPWQPRVNLPLLDGSNGFMIVGNPISYFGESAAGAGDVNGDGYDDVIVGDPGSAAAYVVYGSAAAFPPMFDVIDPPASHSVTVLYGTSPGASGARVAAAGDLNGDAYGDVILESERYPYNRRGAFVVFGDDSLGTTVSLDSLDGTNGFAIRADQGGQYGDGICSVGDINGDGLSDVAFGNSFYSGMSTAGGSGIVIVVFGKTTPYSPVVDIGTMTDSDGFRLYGNYMNDDIGYAISAAGDVNGDGIGDMIFGSYYYSTGYPEGFERGASFVFFGQTQGLTGSIPTTAINGLNGYAIRGAGNEDRMGWSVSGAGDFNGDGLWDQLTGGKSNGIYGGYTGQCYLTHGKPGQSGAVWNELSTVDGTNGFRINPAAAYDELGSSVAHAGDVNGDGASDIIMGAPYARPAGTTWPGAAYLVFGNISTTTGTYKAKTAAGDAPPTAVGTSGLTKTAVPEARVWIDYADGSESTETVVLARSKEAIGNIGRNQVADVLWQVTTTRTGWTSAEVTFHYTDPEVATYDESQLLVYKAPTINGPWTPLTSVVDAAKNRVSASVTEFSYFAIATSSVPVTLSGFTLD